jgi:hypothetical protein
MQCFSEKMSRNWCSWHPECLDSNSSYDALIVIGFGGPEKREEVIPFLENVLRGRNVPR